MNSKIFTHEFKTSFGELFLGSFEEKLCLCDWKYRQKRVSIDNRLQTFFQSEYVPQKTKTISESIQQLEEYFSGKRKEFSIPLVMAGTEFQKSVWNELLRIPFGQTCSYLQLSHNLKNPKAIRAIASANGANAISIFIPCHRIVGHSGDLVGYAGGIPTKRRLLELENPKEQGLFSTI